MRGRWILIAVAALLVGIAAGAFTLWWEQRSLPETRTETAAEPEPTAELSLQGVLSATNVVSVPAPIEGVLEMVMVDVGQEVSRGMLLAQVQSQAIDTELQFLKDELDDAELQVGSLESQLVSQRLDASRARAELDRAREVYTDAQQEAERQRTLYRRGATPRLVYQEAESHLENIQKEYQAVEAETRQTVNRMDATETDLDAARRRVDQLNRSIDEVNSEIEAAQIVSPVDGIVTGMAARQGEAIHPEMDTLIQIATDLSRMQVILEPSPAQMAAMYPGQSVRVFVAELPGEALEGTITEMTIGRAIVEFLNPSPRVRPGLTAQVLVARSR